MKGDKEALVTTKTKRDDPLADLVLIHFMSIFSHKNPVIEFCNPGFANGRCLLLLHKTRACLCERYRRRCARYYRARLHPDRGSYKWGPSRKRLCQAVD